MFFANALSSRNNPSGVRKEVLTSRKVEISAVQKKSQTLLRSYPKEAASHVT